MADRRSHCCQERKKRKKIGYGSPIWGPLKTEQLAQGSDLAAGNAARLLADARTLLGIGRYPSAAFFAIIAIEELGKLPILDSMASVKTEELPAKWKDYRSHTSKNARWILPALVDSGPKTIEELAAVVNPNSWHQQLLDEIKQLALYSDCLEGGNWSTPLEFATQAMAQDLIDIACRLISAAKPVNEDDLALRAECDRKMDAVSSSDEKKRIQAEYFRESSRLGYNNFTEETIRSLLYGAIDLRDSGRLR